jgi:hypothetical protein
LNSQNLVTLTMLALPSWVAPINFQKKKTSMGKASGFTEHLVGMGLVIGAPVGQEHTNF